MSIIKLRHAADLLVLAYRRSSGESVDWNDVDAAHEAARAAIRADNRRIAEARRRRVTARIRLLTHPPKKDRRS